MSVEISLQVLWFFCFGPGDTYFRDDLQPEKLLRSPE